MADHELISAQLAVLAARLPAQAVEELADGLQESYEHHLRCHGDSEVAARAAIAQFGDAEMITAAFVRASPWRRMNLALLATGPIMAAVWAAALLSGHAWDWPLPAPAKILYGVALLSAAIMLAFSALTTRNYRRMRRAVTSAAIGLILLDLVMMIAVLTLAPTLTWPMAIAIPASLLRVLAVGRTLPAASAAQLY
ncbi:hypothetical protein GBF35_29125 [Nonomuraea phyllanthi]|uniref:hypothetical protein n=1 Tax=Nonomuraea phyllanthi TaxID=2219224 RepID=UPI0012933574|nr:hypothetical protein [Nonomuraea phyllanthi]QFY10162.1 hypothetical protein GBF35_29125 [Nonomuraea phyllanthi]